MERLKIHTLSFPKKKMTKFFTGFVIAGVLAFLAACNEGGSSGSGATTYYPYGAGCVGCGNIANPVLLTTFSTQSADGNVALTNMQTYAQSTQVGYVASGNTYKAYEGPIAMQGQLVVRTSQADYMPGTNQKASNCVLPAGTYTLQTYTAGTMSYYGVNVMMPSLITSTGGIELKIEAPSPMGFLTGGQQLWARVYVTRVNGYACSSNFFGEFL
ncbi:MAG: hypothetical protein AAGB31_02020 [Bdellovibrio sp.]